MAKINFDQDIDCESLARFLDQRDVQLPQNLASCPITPKQVFRSDLICMLRKIVLHSAEYSPARFAFEGEERGIEATLKPTVTSVANEYGFEERLWDVDMSARTRSIVVTLCLYISGVMHFMCVLTHSSCGIVSPAVYAGKLLSSHASTPPCMLHRSSRHRNFQTRFLQSNISQTL